MHKWTSNRASITQILCMALRNKSSVKPIAIENAHMNVIFDAYVKRIFQTDLIVSYCLMWFGLQQ